MVDRRDSKDRPLVYPQHIEETHQSKDLIDKQIQNDSVSSPSFITNYICNLCNKGIADTNYYCSFCGMRSHISCLMSYYQDKLPFITCQNCSIKIKNIINDKYGDNRPNSNEDLNANCASSTLDTIDSSSIFSCLNLIFENTSISNEMKAELFKLVTNGVQLPSTSPIQNANNNSGNYNVHLNNLSINFPYFFQPMININASASTAEPENIDGLLRKKHNISLEKREIASSSMSLKKGPDKGNYNNDIKTDTRKLSINLNENNPHRGSAINKTVKEVSVSVSKYLC